MNKAFEEILDKLKGEIYNDEFVLYEDVVKAINEVAKKHNGGWIPCSERLPDSSCDVIITTRSLVNGVGYYFGKDRRWIQWYSGGGIAVDVIAWQPLPEPFKAD